MADQKPACAKAGQVQFGMNIDCLGIVIGCPPCCPQEGQGKMVNMPAGTQLTMYTHSKLISFDH